MASNDNCDAANTNDICTLKCAQGYEQTSPMDGGKVKKYEVKCAGDEDGKGAFASKTDGEKLICTPKPCDVPTDAAFKTKKTGNDQRPL